MQKTPTTSPAPSARIDAAGGLLTRRSLLKGLAATPALGLATARANSFPGDQPIRIVVPFAPGGSTDIIARILAVGLGKALAANVIVENIPGATGTVGAARVARATANGHTLLLGISATQAIAPALFKGLPYKPEQDFVALGRVTQAGILVLAHPDFEANTITELVAMVRNAAKPPIYGTWGSGSAGHLMMESIAVHAKAKMEQAAYKGEAPEIQALLSGEIRLGTAGASMLTLQHLKTGKIKALGISGQRRWSLLPELPTLLEQGIPFKPSSWFGLFAPANTPEAITQPLIQALASVLAQPQTAEKLRNLGMDVEPVSLQEFRREIAEDTRTWAQLVAVSGATAN